MSYRLANKVRIVTAASLFDGHDAAINIMRRIMQSKGAEIIHLGHNRSVKEIVETAIEEDVQGIAITSYQGGHVEFFKYMKDLLEENGCGHIKIFGGGGGTILPAEIDELHKYGITRIYSPDDGRKLGLEGMIEEVIRQCSPLPASPGGGRVDENSTFWEASKKWNGKLPLNEAKDIRKVARAITLAENENKGERKYDGSSITVQHFKADPLGYSWLKKFALDLWKEATAAENVLWDKLRNKKEGYKFRRQHVIGNFIADFVCLKKGLIVEVDGNYHQLPEMKISDEERSIALKDLGFNVIRVSNDELLYQTESVLGKIHSVLAGLPDKENFEDKNKWAEASPTREDLERAPVLGITGTYGQ